MTMHEARITITQSDPRSVSSVALIEELDRHLNQLYPAESNHLMDLDALCAPDVRFFVADMNGETLGCGAVKQFAGYTEVKRVYVARARARTRDREAHHRNARDGDAGRGALAHAPGNRHLSARTRSRYSKRPDSPAARASATTPKTTPTACSWNGNCRPDRLEKSTLLAQDEAVRLREPEVLLRGGIRLQTSPIGFVRGQRIELDESPGDVIRPPRAGESSLANPLRNAE